MHRLVDAGYLEVQTVHHSTFHFFLESIALILSSDMTYLDCYDNIDHTIVFSDT